MTSDELDELVEEPFAAPDLSVMWDDILSHYKTMGFGFPLTDAARGTRLTDNEMVEEFKWVHQQYRKYIGKKRGELIELKVNLPKFLATVKDMIAKDSVVPEDRKTLVYQSMKSQWLNDLWNHIAWIAEQIEEDEGEVNE